MENLVKHRKASKYYETDCRCTLRLTDFIPRASELYLVMVVQEGNRNQISQQIKKSFQRNPEILAQY